MRRVLFVGILATMLGALVSSVGMVSAGGGSQRETLRLRTRDVHIFGGTQRLTPRDEVAVSATLHRGGRRVGRMLQACVVADRNETLVCDATFVLNGRGQIESQGVWQGVTSFQRTGVTGGTGAFKDAGGAASWDLEDREVLLILVP